MRNNRLLSLLLAPLLVMVLAAAAVLVDPAPISVPPGLNDAAVAKAIRLGAAKRGWIISRDEPGYMEATLNVRVHMAKISFKYDTRQIAIHYLASENLEYETDGSVARIHGNYLKWVNNLVHDINVQLAAALPEAATPASP